MQYKVMRHHIGDQEYQPGDTREAKAADVQHLVRSGVLLATGDDKSEPPLENPEGAENPPATKTKKA
ncbi:hypothetical protein ACQZ4Q_01480 [Agrobacterium vitis]